MQFGVFIFPTEYTIDVFDLARAAEALRRGDEGDRLKRSRVGRHREPSCGRRG